MAWKFGKWHGVASFFLTFGLLQLPGCGERGVGVFGEVLEDDGGGHGHGELGGGGGVVFEWRFGRVRVWWRGHGRTGRS